MYTLKINELEQDILQSGQSRIQPSEALALIPATTEQTLDLIQAADRIRRRFKQQKAFTCAIVNAKSGFCAEDCAFCAQSAHHQTDISTYGLHSAEKLVDIGLRMSEAGATNYSMVTSGTCLNAAEIDTVCQVAQTLKARTNLTLCASLGMLSEDAARQLGQAGITRYHHNLETARSFFDQICTTHDYEDDIQTVLLAKRAGLKVCSGGIFGLGESWEQRVELAFTLRDLGVDSIPVNFLNPIPGTRLAGRALLAPLEALACIALLRFIHPGLDIPVCGGREVTLKDFQSWVFLAGANGLMVGNYLTTRGRKLEMDMEMIKEMGMTHAE
ncbi:MAG: biotin synthase BioB [Desulfosarcinaceae bacterium]